MRVTEKWVTQILLAAAMCMPLQLNPCVCQFLLSTYSLASSKMCGSKDGESQLSAADLKLRERSVLKTEFQAVADSQHLSLSVFGKCGKRTTELPCPVLCPPLPALFQTLFSDLYTYSLLQCSKEALCVGILSTGGVYLSVPSCSGLFRLTLLNSEYFRVSSRS